MSDTEEIVKMLAFVLLGLLTGSVCSQRGGPQEVQTNSFNGLQNLPTGENTPLENFQNLLPSSMLPAASDQFSQNSEQSGNLRFATGNINTVIGNKLSSRPLPYVPEISNQMPPFVDAMSHPNIPPFDIPRNLGRTDFINLPPMEQNSFGSDSFGPQIPPFSRELSPLQPKPFFNFVPIVRNNQDRQFERILDKPVFDSPFSPAFPPYNPNNQNMMKDFVEPHFSKPLPFFLEENRFDKTQYSEVNKGLTNSRYQSQDKNSQSGGHDGGKQPEYTTSTTTVEPTTTEIPTTSYSVTTTPDMTSTSPSFPGYEIPSEKKSKQPNDSLFPMSDINLPEYNRRKSMYTKRSRFGSSKYRVIRKHKYGGRFGRQEKAGCKHRFRARNQRGRGDSSNESR